MGLLDGGIAAAFAGAFGALYLDGTLFRPVEFNDDGTGGGGSDDNFAPGQKVKVQVDQVTEAMRAAEGYVDGDVRILMLAHGVAAPNTDCELLAYQTRYLIESVSIDAAGTYYELRGRLRYVVP